MSKPELGTVLVIGGCGFLGHHVVEYLLAHYSCRVAVIDLRTTRNRREKADYYDADITDSDALNSLFSKIEPTVVIHTASPTLMGATHALYKKVNVDGTRAVIEACQNTGVKALVYTSSASIVHDNQSDLVNADERWPVLTGKAQSEYYSQTKAEAEELVLAANRKPGSSLLTCALRPAGIFGEGDVQFIPNVLAQLPANRTGWQLGDNNNLFDVTYVGNVAQAHALAAVALLASSRSSTIPLDYEKVDGEAFFITNGTPIYFWDFARAVWKAGGSKLGTEHVWTISQGTGLLLGSVLETIMWLLGRTPSLTTRQVKYSCMTRYYDITKARKRLGYTPAIGLSEGITRGVKYILEQEKRDQTK